MPLFGNDRVARTIYIEQQAQRFDRLTEEIALLQALTHDHAKTIDQHVSSIRERLADMRDVMDRAAG